MRLNALIETAPFIVAGPHPGRAMLGLKRSPLVLAGDADYGNRSP